MPASLAAMSCNANAMQIAKQFAAQRAQHHALSPPFRFKLRARVFSHVSGIYDGPSGCGCSWWQAGLFSSADVRPIQWLAVSQRRPLLNGVQPASAPRVRPVWASVSRYLKRPKAMLYPQSGGILDAGGRAKAACRVSLGIQRCLSSKTG